MVKLLLLSLLLPLHLCFLFFLVNSVSTQSLPPSSKLERAALLNLRASLGIKAKYWPKKHDPCTNWTGVTCSNGTLTGLNLSGLRRTRYGLRNPSFAIDSLMNCTGLISFNSSGFYLPGSIPVWLGQNLSALQVLDLRSSSVSGPIPPSIGSLDKLNVLLLSGNSITGSIPDSWSRLSLLSNLNLSVNMLTGSIPSSLSALRRIKILDLSSNSLSGPIPPELGSLSSLKRLNFSNNTLAADIPLQLANLHNLVELDLSFNDLGGEFSDNLTMNMRDIVFFDVSSNNFTGNLPDLTVFSNASGVTLNFSNNKFYGNLSSSLPNASLIDLSNNYLQGLEVNRNNTLLSTNCFRGQPDQRSLTDCNTFYVLSGLPFDEDYIAPVPPPVSRKSNKDLKYVFAGVFGGLGVIVIVVIILVLILKPCYKRSASQRSANVEPVQEEGTAIDDQNISIDLISFTDSFTYEQMLQATSGFNDANLIKHGHSGDIFSGRLEDGTEVVIKRIDMRSSRKDCYMSELVLYSKGTHTRLVPLLGHCLEHETEKLMVYKYMPNGDLSNSLYRCTDLEDDGLQSLDWITRLKIATGAAEGLAYLHHDCNPPFVHRDIQASSILLDNKYEVCLGSLSEVCAQEVDNNQNAITKLLRISSSSESTPSGSLPANCAYDVYCFGKVLLELVTGRLGISNSEDTSTKEWIDQTLSLVNNYDRDLVSKFVDQSLVIDEDLLEEVWAVAIVAKSCLNPKPAKRPQMAHVLKALENPFRVVREEDFSAEILRKNSSKTSWSTLFGNWRQSFSGSAHSQGQSQTNKDGNGGSKLSGRDNSQGSGGTG
ncbi:putative LRR receptor-like serine/threonine-protein kinase At2g16250 [Bidens hawaiensis]|uniref:putative LRR receptor-like serine/threonine-protein kinase At2g16250 n=1 Tax=Bidens hawaiensis TaxID=980011 RepID=UPI00404B14DC